MTIFLRKNSVIGYSYEYTPPTLFIIEPYRYQLNQEMAEKVQNDSLLQKSFEEYGKSTRKFTYQPNSKDSDLAKNVYKSARIMNDTTKAHNLADMVAKISNDTGIKYEFTNTKGLKDNGYNISGQRVINGVNTKDGRVLINVDSSNALNRVVGHETTHLFENTEDYKTLQNAVFEYAKTKGEYDARRKELEETYKGVDANIDNELTSDLVGDYLFTDADFVKHLSKNRNIFQKIYDKIKHLYKMATAGSKEKRQLEKAKRTFEKVYQKNKAEVDNKNKYHIADNLSQNIDAVLNDITIRTPVKLRDYTPKILVDSGIKDLPMYENPSHIRKNILTDAEAKKLGLAIKPKDHYHGLGKKVYMDVIDSLDNPRVIFKKKNKNNEFLILTMVKDKNKNNIIVPIEVETTTKVNNLMIDINRVKTVYGYDRKKPDLNKYIKDNISANKLEKIYEYKKKNSSTNITSQLSSSANNVPQSSTNVKSGTTKYSISKTEKNTKELENSSFSFADAKRYDDLIKTNYIEYFRKDNGDVKVYLMDSNNNSLNEFNLWSNTNAIKELGQNLGSKIYENATDTNQRIKIGNDINNLGKDTDYFMNHRPSTSYGNASNFEENMPDIFEHPEWYLNLDEKYNRESLNALKKVRKNPEAELTIYRATIGNKINAGDWVTPSKSYAEYHNNSQFNGEGNILEMKVKAKDIQFAGDDINEFGYFPTNETKYSLSQKSNVNTPSNSDITSKDVKIAPINKELKVLRKEVRELKTLLPKVNKDALVFSKQVDDVIKGTFPKGNMLTLSKTTPKILQDIGLNNHPITMTQRHLKTVMNATGKYKGANYHDLGVGTIKKIPEALNNPLNVLKSSTDDNSIVVVTDLADKQERPIIASIKIDGTGTVDNIKIMSNVLTSTYGKDNYDNFMQKNIENGNLLYDIDEGIVKRVDGKLQLRPINSFSTNDNTTNELKSQKVILPVNSMNKKRKNTINLPVSENVKKVNFNKAIKTDAKNIAKTINNILDTSKMTTVKGFPELKLRKWVETSTESEVVDHKLVIEDMDTLKATYEVKSNKKSLEKANNKINLLGYEKSLEYFNSKLQSDTLPRPEEVIMGERLLQEAIKQNDMVTAKELIENISIMGTELGQATQALSVIKKLTPEGQLKMLTKVVQTAKTRGNKAFEDVKITPEMVEKILKTYKKDGTWSQDELTTAVEQVKQDIADQLKVTAKDKIDEWRYLAMLGNPKTHIRNLVSNVAMKGTLAIKNATARSIESILPIKNRTKTWAKTTEVVKDYAKTTTEEMKNDIMGKNKYNEKADIESRKKVFKSKVLQGASEFNSNMLEKEDWLFSKSAFRNSFEEYLIANEIKTQEDIDNNPELISKAKAYALKQAEIATFRQYSWMASQISRIENKNAITKVGIGATIPFKKTPINIAKTGLNYSPLGFAKTIFYDGHQVINGKMEASQLIDDFSQNLTGTSLLMIGYALAKAGFLNGAGDDDKEDKYDKALGEQGYSLKLGDNTYSISWLSPIAIPLLEGATLFHQLEEQKDWDMNVITETLAKTLDPLSEMSFLSGLDDALSSYDSGVMKLASFGENMVQSYVSQFFPTLFSQFASVGDDKMRSTTASKNSKYNFGETTVKKVMYKIPFLRNKLEVATDIWGNEKTQSDNIATRAFESFIAPYAKKKDISTGLDTELKNVYRSTGDSSVLPGTPYSYLNYNGEKYEMSASEYTKYKKTYGQTASEYLNALVQNDNYINASDDEKATMIGKMYDYAKALANEEYFSNKDVDYESNNLKTINALNDLNMTSDNIGEYVSLTTKSSEIKNMDNLDAKDKKQQITDLMTKSSLNDEQLAYTYSKYYSSKDTIDSMLKLNIPIKEYIKFNSQNFENSYNSKGQTIKNSKKNALIKYVNSLNLSVPQKASLIKMSYSSYKTYDNQIMNYVNKQGMDFLTKAKTVKILGFTKYDKSIINYVKNNYSSVSMQSEVLDDLGFNVYKVNGGVYVK